MLRNVSRQAPNQDLPDDSSDDLPDEVILEGPRALRLIAHEARQTVLAELYSGRELTATDAAALCGVSPSAMSYHLRLLAKAGLVTRTAATRDGRERPWRAVARRFTLAPGSGAPGPELNAAALMWTKRATRAIEEWIGAGTPRGSSLQRHLLNLSAAENSALLDELEELFRRYDDLSDRHSGAAQGGAEGTWETYIAHVRRRADPVRDEDPPG